MTITNKSMLRSFFLAFAGLCMSFLLFGLEGYATRATGTVKNPILNVRTEASTASSIRCKLTKGVKVTILSETTGTDGMKWYNVYFSKNNEAMEGYVRSDLVLVSGSTASSGTATDTTSNLRAIRPNAAIVRSKPTTSSSILTRLYKGTIISVVSEQTSTDNYKWSKVNYIESGVSKEGYIRSDLLTNAPAGATMTGSTASSSSSSSSASSGTKKTVNTAVAIVRSYASTNGDIRTRLMEGTEVTVLKTVTGSDDQRTWYKVSYLSGGVSGEGYIRGDLLSDINDNSSASDNNASGGTSENTATKSAIVTPLVANIRSYASTNGDIRSKLPQGTVVTILLEKTGDDNQKWYKISYNYGGKKLEGYIRGDLVTFSTSSSGGSSTPSTGDSNTSGNSGNSGNAVATVYSYASPDADIRASLPNGTKVTVLKEVTGEDGAKWTKIGFQLDGKQVEGYVKSSVLKS